MDKKKFLQQVYSKIKEKGIPQAENKEDCINILSDDVVIFKIDSKGGMFYSSDKKIANLVDELHDKIQPIVTDVGEYLKAMETAPELKARDFNMAYRILAEFNDTVFAATEHSNGSFEFATWDRHKDSLYHGHYFTDYRVAKQDFATRSGLISKQLVFDTEELIEIYRSLADTESGGYELSDKQEELIEKIQNKIKDTETHKFNFEKEDSYSDIVLKDVPRVVKSGEKDVVVLFDVENFSKLLYPEKISIKSVKGKECVKGDEKAPYNVYNGIVVPFEPDGFERDYIVTVPDGTIMLDDGLNKELVFNVHNDIEYVVPENFLISVSPMVEHIKYISGEREDITITIKIKDGFKVDKSKPIYFNRESIEYSTDITGGCTTLSFTVNVTEAKKHNVEFGEGLVIGPNGEKLGPKHNYNFSVVNINTVDLPENLIFTDLPVDHWAIDYIVQLALDNIISGYEDKTFKPGGNVTRSELAKMLSVAFDLEGASIYDDIEGHWAKGYIEDCGEFIPGEEDRFRPNDEATRQDVAVALVNILENTKKRKLQEGTLSFNDVPMIDTEYIPHIGKAVEGGIISGYSDGTFRPQEPITRAEVATMIYRVYR